MYPSGHMDMYNKQHEKTIKRQLKRAKLTTQCTLKTAMVRTWEGTLQCTCTRTQRCNNLHVPAYILHVHGTIHLNRPRSTAKLSKKCIVEVRDPRNRCNKKVPQWCTSKMHSKISQKLPNNCIMYIFFRGSTSKRTTNAHAACILTISRYPWCANHQYTSIERCVKQSFICWWFAS